MSRRERPRKRPKSELQLYRERMREEALERRAQYIARGEALVQRRRELRAAARAEMLADAQQSLELAKRPESGTRLEYQDPDRTGMWSGLALGVGVAALVGVAGVMVYLLVRKKDGQVVGVQPPMQGLGYGYTPPIIINSGGGMSAEITGSLATIARTLGAPESPWTSSTMKTYTLPSLNDRTRGAIRVAQATDVPYEVVLRTIGPAGTYAAFSMNVTELNTYQGNVVTQPPLGDVVLLPTSQYQVIKLRPREVLYAKGSQSNVIVSISSNQVAGGARALL